MNDKKETATISSSGGKLKTQSFIGIDGRAFIQTYGDAVTTTETDAAKDVIMITVLTNKSKSSKVIAKIAAILKAEFTCSEQL